MADDPKPADQKYLDAKKHVAAIRGFYIHLFIFACVNGLLLAINLISKSEWWFQWPLLGWGIGLAGHAIAVFLPFNILGKDWEERRIQQVMADRKRKV